MAEPAEQSIPGYTEIRELGRGATGRVVLARRDADGELVAIKYLAEQLVGDTAFTGRFFREAALMAAVQDPNVVRLHEVRQSPDGRSAAIVMEAVEGPTLRQLLGTGHGSPESALALLRGSLLGLAAAHDHGVVHRDYKPDNVLVDATGTSKLTDFGIAAPAGGLVMAEGTPGYMPPEQWRGQPASPASDMYAAAVTFYECLTGSRPFRADTMEELRTLHESAPVPVQDVPEPVRDLLARGLAKDPADRYEDVRAFVADVEATAVAGYGPDWLDRGVRDLAYVAAGIIAALPLLALAAAAGGLAGTALAGGAAPAGGAATAAGAAAVGAAGAGAAGAASAAGAAVAAGAGAAGLGSSSAVIGSATGAAGTSAAGAAGAGMASGGAGAGAAGGGTGAAGAGTGAAGAAHAGAGSAAAAHGAGQAAAHAAGEAAGHSTAQAVGHGTAHASKAARRGGRLARHGAKLLHGKALVATIAVAATAVAGTTVAMTASGAGGGPSGARGTSSARGASGTCQALVAAVATVKVGSTTTVKEAAAAEVDALTPVAAGASDPALKSAITDAIANLHQIASLTGSDDEIATQTLPYLSAIDKDDAAVTRSCPGAQSGLNPMGGGASTPSTGPTAPDRILTFDAHSILPTADALTFLKMPASAVSDTPQVGGDTDVNGCALTSDLWDLNPDTETISVPHSYQNTLSITIAQCRAGAVDGADKIASEEYADATGTAAVLPGDPAFQPIQLAGVEQAAVQVVPPKPGTVEEQDSIVTGHLYLVSANVEIDVEYQEMDSTPSQFTTDIKALGALIASRLPASPS